MDYQFTGIYVTGHLLEDEAITLDHKGIYIEILATLAKGGSRVTDEYLALRAHEPENTVRQMLDDLVKERYIKIIGKGEDRRILARPEQIRFTK